MKRFFILAASLVAPLCAIWVALTMAPLLVGPQPAAASTTQVGGLISSDTTWTLANSPYVVTDNILVNTGVTLTIEPGVTVRFDSGKYLWVKGTLLAVGTPTNRIRFTSNRDNPAPGDWGGIAFTKESGSGSRLEFSIIEYGGGTHEIESILFVDSPLLIASSSPTIRHNVLINNVGLAIWIRDVRGGGNLPPSYPAAPIISYNLIKNTTGSTYAGPKGIGIGFWWSVENFTGTITYNTIIGNGVGIKFDNYPAQTTSPIQYNNIHSNSSYDVALSLTAIDKDLTNNYWGIADANVIASHIYDFNDDFNQGRVLYSPIQTTPVITAPLAPPTGVVTSVTGSNVSLSWSANAESDLAGYNVYRRAASDTAYQKLTTSVLASTAYQDSPPTYGTFYYAITAVDTSSEESWYSDPISVTIQSPTPTPTPTATATATSTPLPTATPTATHTPTPTPIAVYLPIVTRASSGW